eukprot:gb/GFBE01024487.1/.p1 GENE.gb/GFBE01024487.1/~~gb/GFBE01024487.1/.p1  ORF type:complete len:341 (+),score=87.60 gb/GFBE01024487.1/:1-1023(+)
MASGGPDAEVPVEDADAGPSKPKANKGPVKKNRRQLVEDLASREDARSRAHLNSCGKQVLSARATSPRPVFGYAERASVQTVFRVRNKATPSSLDSNASTEAETTPEAFIEPGAAVPGVAAAAGAAGTAGTAGAAGTAGPAGTAGAASSPAASAVLSVTPDAADFHYRAITPMAKSFGSESRFPGELSDRLKASSALALSIKKSTNASPFSKTYPYEEPTEKKKPAKADADAEKKDPLETQDGEAGGGGYSKTLTPRDNDAERRLKDFTARGRLHMEMQAYPEATVLHMKACKPAWSFGRAGLGIRLSGRRYAKSSRKKGVQEMLEEFEFKPTALLESTR